MKIATTVVRIALGLVYTVFALAFFFNLLPQQEMNGPAEQFMTGLFISGYMLPLIKVIELICGILFLIGRMIPLVTVVIFPITLNIILFHIFLAPEGTVVPLLMLGMNLFLAYTCRGAYKDLMTWKFKPAPQP